MLPFKRINKKYVLFGAALLLIISASAYYMINRSFSGQENSIFSQETEVAKPDGKFKITNNTDIVQKTLYLRCNDEEVLKTKPAERLVGLNIYQMQKIYQGWDFETFDNNEAVMTLKVDSFCREHANNIFIGVKDDHVAVFYGRPGYKPIIKEVTSIEVSKLMPHDIEELQKGMIVQSKEELLRKLEGMQSR